MIHSTTNTLPGSFLNKVRTNHPLIHCITNYVTVNDVANILLASGASPIMADDELEVEEITTLCAGLVLNIGTLNSRTIPSMLKAGKKAKELGHPVVLDPVGAGASTLRTKTAMELLTLVKPTVIRGNLSEVKVLAKGSGQIRGVDVSFEDGITEENAKDVAAFAKDFSAKTGGVIAITGPIDIVADKEKACLIRNGTKEMAKVTGTGCMVSALTAAFAAASEEKTAAVAAAIALMGLCGEITEKKLLPGEGNATLRTGIIDSVCTMDEATMNEQTKIEWV